MRGYPNVYNWTTADAFLRRGRNPSVRWIGVGRRHTFIVRDGSEINVRQHDSAGDKCEYAGFGSWTCGFNDRA